MNRIVIEPDTRVLVLTGAGASADSGVPTFRDANGLWENHRLEEVASPDAFRADPRLVWRFYSERRAGVLTAAPNAGHVALATLERALGDRFLLVTQNVDGLHRRGGSERLVELHGNLLESRCARCDRAPFEDREGYLDTLPGCSECDARGELGLLRPNIVWFGEALDSAHLDRIERFMSGPGALVFVAIGTSGAVYPAAGLVNAARGIGARTWLVNAEPADNTSCFEFFVRGRSADVLPTLFEVR